MFSLIVTVIAIALVVVLAIASIYYGSGTYKEKQALIAAQAITNQAQQIYGAAVLYAQDNAGNWPANTQVLLDGHYLNAIPVPPPNSYAFGYTESPLSGFKAASAEALTPQYTINTNVHAVLLPGVIAPMTCNAVVANYMGNNQVQLADGQLVTVSRATASSEQISLDSIKPTYQPNAEDFIQCYGVANNFTYVYSRGDVVFMCSDATFAANNPDLCPVIAADPCLDPTFVAANPEACPVVAGDCTDTTWASDHPTICNTIPPSTPGNFVFRNFIPDAVQAFVGDSVFMYTDHWLEFPDANNPGNFLGYADYIVSNPAPPAYPVSDISNITLTGSSDFQLVGAYSTEWSTWMGGADADAFGNYSCLNNTHGDLFTPDPISGWSACSVYIKFSPSSGGEKLATLSFSYKGTPYSIPLSGQGIDPNAYFTLSPASATFNGVLGCGLEQGSGQTSQSFTLTALDPFIPGIFFVDDGSGSIGGASINASDPSLSINTIDCPITNAGTPLVAGQSCSFIIGSDSALASLGSLQSTLNLQITDGNTFTVDAPPISIISTYTNTAISPVVATTASVTAGSSLLVNRVPQDPVLFNVAVDTVWPDTNPSTANTPTSYVVTGLLKDGQPVADSLFNISSVTCDTSVCNFTAYPDATLTAGTYQATVDLSARATQNTCSSLVGSASFNVLFDIIATETPPVATAPSCWFNGGCFLSEPPSEGINWGNMLGSITINDPNALTQFMLFQGNGATSVNLMMQDASGSVVRSSSARNFNISGASISVSDIFYLGSWSSVWDMSFAPGTGQDFGGNSTGNPVAISESISEATYNVFFDFGTGDGMSIVSTPISFIKEPLISQTLDANLQPVDTIQGVNSSTSALTLKGVNFYQGSVVALTVDNSLFGWGPLFAAGSPVDPSNTNTQVLPQISNIYKVGNDSFADILIPANLNTKFGSNPATVYLWVIHPFANSIGGWSLPYPISYVGTAPSDFAINGIMPNSVSGVNNSFSFPSTYTISGVNLNIVSSLSVQGISGTKNVDWFIQDSTTIKLTPSFINAIIQANSGSPSISVALTGGSHTHAVDLYIYNSTVQFTALNYAGTNTTLAQLTVDSKGTHALSSNTYADLLGTNLDRLTSLKMDGISYPTRNYSVAGHPGWDRISNSKLGVYDLGYTVTQILATAGHNMTSRSKTITITGYIGSNVVTSISFDIVKDYQFANMTEAEKALLDLGIVGFTAEQGWMGHNIFPGMGSIKDYYAYINGYVIPGVSGVDVWDALASGFGQLTLNGASLTKVRTLSYQDGFWLVTETAYSDTGSNTQGSYTNLVNVVIYSSSNPMSGLTSYPDVSLAYSGTSPSALINMIGTNGWNISFELSAGANCNMGSPFLNAGASDVKDYRDWNCGIADTTWGYYDNGSYHYCGLQPQGAGANFWSEGFPYVEYRKLNFNDGVNSYYHTPIKVYTNSNPYCLNPI